MNKHIRVLTGRHAGASLDLLPGDWTVDSADTAAVRISDWTDAPLQLQVGIETGVLHVDDEAAAPWPDLEPRRFGEIVLCVGPAGEPWPSDLELLQRLLAPPPPVVVPAADTVTADASPTAPPAHRPRAHAGWMGVAAVALLTPCALLLASTREAQNAPQAPAVAPIPLIERVRTALSQHNIDGLNIEQRDGEITVHGMAPTAMESLSVQRDLRNVSPRVRVDMPAAPEVVENLRESMQEPGLSISYLGDNRFSVSGAAQQPDRVRAVVDRVRGDLGVNVKDIALNVRRANQDGKLDANSVLSVDELHYVESPDGTKRFLAAQH
ncbi:HrpD5 family protein [Ralstonia pseudosolanacearum]|uniref:HrpD5 family protein n=1 Tax=Ralstonia pseudosolanacearum TaxID=1310165 RepID=UPI00267765C2|nr:HrpD5 family protein [Ralstonia pseudosolanacearum]MDO3563272.1 HrpD5 family protein [Ralstonia pseudosolanacearum]MDO3572218.1 HrpD5 family protein [Ralstonia pseudosolanacearum]MDO3605756.1 HrpD5 family protein [Ralstonia pseudosolanacearum]MDO3611604.1 HrpD5 family protein [Ralstonia pseudosolanacearum]MDO3614802.1 HrpD5 family protein [Ralstonia pseudosolanacearum]